MEQRLMAQVLIKYSETSTSAPLPRDQGYTEQSNLDAICLDYSGSRLLCSTLFDLKGKALSFIRSWTHIIYHKHVVRSRLTGRYSDNSHPLYFKSDDPAYLARAFYAVNARSFASHKRRKCVAKYVERNVLSPA